MHVIEALYLMEKKVVCIYKDDVMRDFLLSVKLLMFIMKEEG
jgi:hypothetical protein